MILLVMKLTSKINVLLYPLLYQNPRTRTILFNDRESTIFSIMIVWNIINDLVWTGMDWTATRLGTMHQWDLILVIL